MNKIKRSILIAIAAIALAASSLACGEDPKTIVIETVSTVQTGVQEGVCTGADAVGAETGTLCK